MLELNCVLKRMKSIHGRSRNKHEDHKKVEEIIIKVVQPEATKQRKRLTEETIQKNYAMTKDVDYNGVIIRPMR